MYILGIAGLSSSGKDTIGDALAEKYFLNKIALSDLVRKAEGNPRMSDSIIRGHADSLRAQGDYGVLARLLIDAAESQGLEGLILTSIRHPAEADEVIRRNNPPRSKVPLIWVEGDYRFLYERRKKRDDGRPLPSYGKFVEEQELQFTGAGPYLNLGQVRAKIPETQRIQNRYDNKKDLIAHGERIFLELFPEFRSYFDLNRSW